MLDLCYVDSKHPPCPFTPTAYFLHDFGRDMSFEAKLKVIITERLEKSRTQTVGPDGRASVPRPTASEQAVPRHQPF